GGASEDEATRLALADFREGNLLAQYLAPLQQAQTPIPVTPGVATGHVLRGAWLDLRYAARMLRKQPAFTIAAVLTLALGIGASTAVFSVVEGVLLRPLPYPDDGRIVRVGATTHSSRDSAASFSDRGYWHFVDNNRSFEKFGAYRVLDSAASLTGDGAPLPVEPGTMTLSAFKALGVFPELGRLPTPEEDAPGAARVALIGHDLWVNRYGADPSILGRRINLYGVPWEVIGVMPAGYDFPTPEVDVWIPLRLNPASQNFGGHNLRAIARLAAGVTIAAATEDARSLIARFDEAGYDASWFERIFDGGAIVRPLRDEIVGDVRQRLLIVFGTVGFVLLIACSNVANLLLARAEGRRQENAVRMALGSSRFRLARHLLIESAMLALLGGAAGVLLAYAGVRALVSVGPADIPRLDEISINGRALVFTALVSSLAGVLFGVLPAVRASSARVTAALRDGGRSAASAGARHRTRNALVMTQVALAFVLVIGSGLMVRSFEALRSVDPGFSAEGVLTFQVRPLRTKYAGAGAVARLYDRLIERLEAVPGVSRAGAIDALPLTGNDDGFAAVIEEFPPVADELPPAFAVRRATPGYFAAMNIPVVEGRTFTPDDHTRQLPAVIISDSVKARYWPNTSALGKRIDIGKASARVVGVVGDVHNAGLDAAAEQFLYLPMVDSAGGGVLAMTMTLRTASEPLSLVSAIRSAIAEVDRDLPMAKVQSMERVLGDSMSRTSFTMSALVIAALIALFLGAVGIYGVLSYVVSLRTPEIGTRLALGASPGGVLGMVLSQGMRLAGAGALLGLVAALALGRVIVALLYDVSPFDPVTLVATSAIFLGVAVLASLLPAARAARTTPVDALRAG
ncbi:MAG TPA: ABC transporter permease, partial [Vicinamibacterales bacterium]|nr:ABC transporter permease [Vicinamibacterales bacterium]